MNDKLKDFTGNIKCPKCGHKFFKGAKGVDQNCPQCGHKFILHEKDMVM